MIEEKPLLGEIIKEAGFITQEMLDFSLKVQSTEKKDKIGQIFKSLGFVSDVELAKGLSKQAGLKYLSLD